MISGFFAYTSKPEVRECISSAVSIINNSKIFKITTWEEMESGGTYIIDDICKSIDSSDIFLADLSYVNHNVLFELGYAIAKNKRIYIFLDTSIKHYEQHFSRLNLSAIRYIGFKSSEELASKFLKEDVENSLSDTFLKRLYSNYPSPPKNNIGTLYLKSIHEDDSAIKLTRVLENTKIKPLIVDDPNEAFNLGLDWYLKQTLQVAIVVGHLVDDERESSELHNPKIALSAGMGYAFGKKVLLLVKEPFKPSLDYLNLLQKYNIASECDKIIKKWLSGVEEDYVEVESAIIAKKEYASSLNSDIDLGNFIAEQEISTLPEYYVQNINPKQLLKSDYTLLIGRKGSGKSALLFMIKHELSQHRKNHVCIIKPIAYELTGLIKVLKTLPEESEKSYLMESLWKFLIYTELAKSIYTEIESRPAYIDLSYDEKELKDFLNFNKSIIEPDFWARFDNIIEKCSNFKNANSDKRIKISEYLHDNLISKLKSLLVQLFKSKYEKVVVLVDNLDKAWQVGEETELLSSFLFGLISVSSRIKAELSPKTLDIDFSLTIFLRSDIFSQIYRIAKERDKLRYQQIKWDDDDELLLQVIGNRLIYNFPEYSQDQIWDKYFCDLVDGVPIKKYIISNIVPRPRDIVFLVLEALRIAISKNHTKIEENDILIAQKRYSQHALDSLIVESEINYNDIETLLYEFVGQSQILSKAQLHNIINSTLGDKYDSMEIIEMLCELAFLGRQVGEDEFTFQYGFNDLIKKSLQKTYSNESGKDNYIINAPYKSYLEIK